MSNYCCKYLPVSSSKSTVYVGALLIQKSVILQTKSKKIRNIWCESLTVRVELVPVVYITRRKTEIFSHSFKLYLVWFYDHWVQVLVPHRTILKSNTISENLWFKPYLNSGRLVPTSLHWGAYFSAKALMVTKVFLTLSLVLPLHSSMPFPWVLLKSPEKSASALRTPQEKAKGCHVVSNFSKSSVLSYSSYVFYSRYFTIFVVLLWMFSGCFVCLFL